MGALLDTDTSPGRTVLVTAAVPGLLVPPSSSIIIPYELRLEEVCRVVGREAERERVRGVSGDIPP